MDSERVTLEELRQGLGKLDEKTGFNMLLILLGRILDKIDDLDKRKKDK